MSAIGASKILVIEQVYQNFILSRFKSKKYNWTFQNSLKDGAILLRFTVGFNSNESAYIMQAINAMEVVKS